MFKIQSFYINPSGIYNVNERNKYLYRVYKNPNAKDLFIKAQNSTSVEERAKLFAEMGDYKLVDELPKTHSKNRLMQFLKGLFSSID